jgi:chromosome segregation ATPase
MRDEIFEIDREIEKLQAKRKELESHNQRDFNALPENYRLAEILHKKRCKANHTDQCGWYYEDWLSPGYSREHWVDIADKVLEQMKYEEAVNALEILG